MSEVSEFGVPAGTLHIDPLYGVLWSDDGTNWFLVVDEGDTAVPAIYVTHEEAERRRSALEVEFSDEASHRIVLFEVRMPE